MKLIDYIFFRVIALIGKKFNIKKTPRPISALIYYIIFIYINVLYLKFYLVGLDPRMTQKYAYNNLLNLNVSALLYWDYYISCDF